MLFACECDGDEHSLVGTLEAHNTAPKEICESVMSWQLRGMGCTIAETRGL